MSAKGAPFHAPDPREPRSGNPPLSFAPTHDYAADADPTGTSDSSVTLDLEGTSLVLPHRVCAEDVFMTLQRSTDLVDWTEMVAGTDYSIESFTLEDIQELIAIDLLIDPAEEPELFIRQVFETTP